MSARLTNRNGGNLVRKKTKIVIFIVGVLVLLVLVLLAPYGIRVNLAAIGGIIIAGFAGISRRGKPVNDTRADADRKERDAERENREAVGSMDSVLRDGEGLRVTGEQLVRDGERLVGESQSLIDELRKGDAGANKGT